MAVPGRDLIRQMSKENPLWGAPRIHGELLKLGFELAESTVSKYMIKHRTCTDYSLPVSRRTAKNSGHYPG
jgi:hypothetical protein